MPVFYPGRNGAKGDGKTKDTRAIQQCVDDCFDAGGGVVYLTPGVYLTGTIILKSNVTLYLDAGATLLGSTDLSDYAPQPGPDPKNDANDKHLIFARNAENISICGTGVIGMDALQEVQVQTSNESAELASTGGGVILFELKSGTNKFHGSAFEFLQNQFLNTWSNKFFLAGCSPSDAKCLHNYSKPVNRFNDYGFSTGGPIWKNHTYVFGDLEQYKDTDYTRNPNAATVPTARMLGGDFGELLTGGTRQGTMLNSAGQPWINPCTGNPYQYGQIFDPQTQMMVNNVTCATPFPSNIIPAGRISSVSQKLTQVYKQYYVPTNSNVTNNFPTMAANTPLQWKRSIDLKADHNFSTR